MAASEENHSNGRRCEARYVQTGGTLGTRHAEHQCRGIPRRANGVPGCEGGDGVETAQLNPSRLRNANRVAKYNLGKHILFQPLDPARRSRPCFRSLYLTKNDSEQAVGNTVFNWRKSAGMEPDGAAWKNLAIYGTERARHPEDILASDEKTLAGGPLFDTVLLARSPRPMGLTIPIRH
jgi:hypothetical protein